MGKIFNLGIDVGNDSTKSDHTTIVSGYNESSACPITGENSCLFLNGLYYTFNSEPFPYNEDKTDGNRCVILTLMSVAEEIIYTIKNANGDKKISSEELQREISEITSINLAIGLPVLQYATLKDTTEKCYREFFKEPVNFKYNGYEFTLGLGEVVVCVQGFALASSNVFEGTDNLSEILRGQKGCYTIIDNGGMTLDIIKFNPKDYVDVKTKSGQPKRMYRPDVSACTSLMHGSHRMYDHLSREVKRKTGIDLEGSDIEAVLKREPHVIPDDIVSIIFDLTQEWTNTKVFDACKQNGVEFKIRPVIFMGGTSLLLKEFIEKNPMLNVYAFVSDPHANARGYTNTIKRVSQKK